MRIKLVGFKAFDREIDLSRRNLLVAVNGSGKSAIADAIRFLVLGYVPALGKREQDTALLMGNGRLEVTLSLGDGRTATRTLERDGEGYRSTVRASWVRGSRAEHEAAILKLFGSDVEDVAEALDIRELLSLSPAKRAARIEKMVGSGGTADLAIRVARHHVARLLDTDPAQLPETLGDAVSALPPSRASALRAIGKTVTANLREGGIPGCIAWANEAKREAEATAAKRHAARDEIEARLRTLGGTLAIDELQAQRATLEREIGASRNSAAREAERVKRLDDALAGQARAEVTLADAEKQLDRIETTAAEMVAALEAKLPEIDEAIGALRHQTFGTHVDTRRLVQVEAEIAGLVDEPIEDLTRYERMIEEFEAELASAKQSPWVEVRAIAEDIDQSDGGSAFAHRTSRLLELADANVPTTIDVIDGLKAARETLVKRADQAEAATKRNLDRANRRSRLESEARILRDQAAGVSATVRERERKRDIEIDGLNARRAAAVTAIKDQGEKVALQRRHVAELRESLSGLTARVLTLSQAPIVPDAPDEGELERVEAAIKAATARASLKTEFDAIVAELEARDAEVDVFRALEWALKRAREEELATRGAGIVGSLSNFLVAAGRDELPYLESSRNTCDVGWVRSDGRRVSVEAMSGGEYALFCSALTAAVLAARGGEIGLLLVEAAECDADSMRAMLAGIAAAGVTHALVLTAHDVSTLDTGDWHVVRLDAEKARAAA